jgi:outer membrane protein TolC
LASETLQRWLRGDALAWALGAALSLPLHDSGRVRSEQALAASVKDERQALYRWAVLRAWREVAEAQAAVEAAEHARALAVVESNLATQLTQRQRLRQLRGLSSAASTRAQQRTELAAQANLARTQAGVWAAWAELQHAAGS